MGRRAWSDDERRAAERARAVAADVEKRVAAMSKPEPAPPRAPMANIPDDWDIVIGRGSR